MPDFETAWANKEAALEGYRIALAMEHDSAGSIDTVQAALNEYLDAAHDAMQAGLELLKKREAQI